MKAETIAALDLIEGMPVEVLTQVVEDYDFHEGDGSRPDLLATLESAVLDWPEFMLETISDYRMTEVR